MKLAFFLKRFTEESIERNARLKTVSKQDLYKQRLLLCSAKHKNHTKFENRAHC